MSMTLTTGTSGTSGRALRSLSATLLAVVLLVGACADSGSTPQTSPPLAPDDDVTISTPDRPATDQEPGAEPTEGWAPLTPRFDMRSEQLIAPEQVLPTTDGQAILVRFWGGVEPCFGARVELAEFDDSVEVQLFSGLPPGAEVTTCIAMAVAYEIEVPLLSPLGDRQIVIAGPGQAPGDGLQDAVFETDQYLGLTLDEAKELAGIEGRVLRVARIDDQVFALTEDFDPSRVNIEIDDGVVVAVEGW